jgi:molecular chaperone GrpE
MTEKEIQDQETENKENTSETEKVEQKLKGEEELPTHKEEDQVAKLEEELSSANDKHLRLVAEFENYKKRSLRERIDLINTAGVEVISDMLPVLDDFERAIKTMLESKNTDKENLEGVKLIYNKLKSKLEQKGLKAMDSMGKEFDDEHMDAVTQIPVEKKKEKNKVVDVIEKGYFLNGKVIRHAKVVVGS